MSDFRTELYDRYVSTFKESVTDDSRSRFNAFLDWTGYKYGPLLVGLPEDGLMLEVGCGPGDMLEFLQRSGFTRVEGIDLSEEQVRIARERGLNARVADVFEVLESSPEKYRVILAVDLVEHFTKDELMRLVPALRHALEPGGTLILQTPNGEGLFPNQIVYGDLTHLTIFTPDSLKQLFRLFGFGQFDFVEAGPAPLGLKGRFRMLGWRLIKAIANLVRKIETGKSQAIWTETMICRCTKQDEPAENNPV